MIFAVAAFVLSAAWLLACGAGSLLGMIWRARGQGHDVHPWALDAPRIVLAIPLAGWVAASVCLLPARAWTWLTGLCACEAYGGVHICPLHFGDAAVLLVLVVPLAFWIFSRRLPGVAAVVQRSRDLEHLASVEPPRVDGLVPIDHGGKPVVFVAGLRAPRVIVDPSWWDTLCARERRVVAAHEQAHIESRDPLVLAVLESTLRLLAPRASARIVRDWTLASELRADAVAAQRDGDPVYVAQVLCRHARAAAPSGALGIGGEPLDVRVRALLGGRSPARGGLGPWAAWGALIAAGASGHVAHRAFEAVLSILSALEGL
jgi:hypothetical protein